MIRTDKEDYSAQEEALAARREELVQALHDLAGEATAVAKALGRKRPPANAVDGVSMEYRAVLRKEEAYELAALDLRTAKGEDA